MDLTKEEKANLNRVLLKHLMRESRKGVGIPITDMKRQLGNLAEQTGIKTEKLKEFVKELYLELINEAFDY